MPRSQNHSCPVCALRRFWRNNREGIVVRVLAYILATSALAALARALSWAGVV